MPDVYIAEGHGRRPDGSFDPGATDGIHSEQRDSKPVAESCAAVLRNHGLEVISEADMVDDPNYVGTTRLANEAGVKCVVSFHYDWTGAPPGAFMIATSDDGRELGWAIEARVAEAGFDIRDYPDDRDNLYLLNNTNMPAVIFECGRIGHEDIDQPQEQQAMGEAAALGILDWLGVDTMALLTIDDQKKLRHFLEQLEAIGSNTGFVKYTIPWFRRLSGLTPEQLEELEESDEIAAVEAKIDQIASTNNVDEWARELAQTNAVKLARIKEAI